VFALRIEVISPQLGELTNEKKADSLLSYLVPRGKWRGLKTESLPFRLRFSERKERPNSSKIIK